MQVSPPGVTARRCLSGRIAAEPTPSSVLHAAAHACWAEPEAPACHVERSRNISRESHGRTSARPPSFLRRQEPRLGVAPLSLQGERVRERVLRGGVEWCALARNLAALTRRHPAEAGIQTCASAHAVRGMVAGAARTASGVGVAGCGCPSFLRRQEPRSPYPPSFQRRLESSRALPRTRWTQQGNRPGAHGVRGWCRGM